MEMSIERDEVFFLITFSFELSSLTVVVRGFEVYPGPGHTRLVLIRIVNVSSPGLLPKSSRQTSKPRIVAGGDNASRPDAPRDTMPLGCPPLHPAPPLHDTVGVDKVKLNAQSTRELRVLLLPVACCLSLPCVEINCRSKRCSCYKYGRKVSRQSSPFALPLYPLVRLYSQ